MLGDIVQAAGGAGFDAMSVADHVWLHPIVGGPLGNHVEAYTTLGFIAAHTRRVRLLALATAASYRPAGLLAKMVTTLDVLSGGRTMLGIGAGDYPEEAVGLGLPFPTSIHLRDGSIILGNKHLESFHGWSLADLARVSTTARHR
jgi:alkanesulfonate monooxygenase SsuD/methylene tetrahydromethanopterin reductase-like flavin-dependent oxidoreductase (luciferase family)